MGKLVGDRWIDERHIFISAFAITQHFVGRSEEKMFRRAGEMAQSLAVLSENSGLIQHPRGQ